MSATFYELLKYAKTGIASPEMTAYDKLKALAMCKGGFPVATLTGIPPISFKSDGSALTAWSISGNMTQTGTPTPSAPITPEETGDKTANLLDFNALKTAPSSTFSGYTFPHVLTLNVKPNTYYTCMSNGTGNTDGEADTNRCVYFNGAGTVNVVYKAHNVTSMSDSSGVIKIAFESSRSNAAQYLNGSAQIWLVEGTAALDYEPYGYVIPVSCGGQAYTAYLQEPIRGSREYVDIASSSGTVTRRFYCYTAKGTNDEGWAESGTGNEKRFYNVLPAEYVAGNRYSPVVICSHFVKGNASYKNGGCDVYNRNFRVNALSTGFTDLSDFTAWLAEQYAAGTPLKIWYVINTATTETFTAPTITPQKGANTLTVDTDLQPSEVSITGKIKAS